MSLKPCRLKEFQKIQNDKKCTCKAHNNKNVRIIMAIIHTFTISIHGCCHTFSFNSSSFPLNFMCNFVNQGQQVGVCSEQEVIGKNPLRPLFVCLFKFNLYYLPIFINQFCPGNIVKINVRRKKKLKLGKFYD